MALKKRVETTADWLQRAEAFRTLFRWLWQWAFTPTAVGIGAGVVARLRDATAAQAYIYAVAAATIALIGVAAWRQIRHDPEINPPRAPADDSSANGSRAEDLAGPVPTQSERRATIRHFRELVAKVHQRKSRPGEDRSITSLLTMEADFFDLKPYLSETVKNVLFGSGDGVVHVIIRRGAPPGDMDPVLYAMLDDIEKLEVEWGLRPAATTTKPPPAIPKPTPPQAKPSLPMLDTAAEAGEKLKQVVDNKMRQVEAAMGMTTPTKPTTQLPQGIVGLSWHQDNTGLHIDATSHLPEVIREFKLWVTDVRKYSERNKRFVQVELFHEFTELQLWTERGTPATTQIGGVTKLFCGTPVTFAFLYRDAAAIWFRGRTRDASVEQKIIREDGIWEITLRCEVEELQRIETLMFEWRDVGKQPSPYNFSVPVSKALPPIRPVGGGSR